MQIFGVMQNHIWHILRAPDAPQNVRFCRNPRKINFQKMREKRNWKNQFSLFSQNRTNTDEFGRNPKNKTPCFPQYEFLRGRIRTSFFLGFSKNFGNYGKIADEFWGVLIFCPPFIFPDRDMTLYRFWWVGGRQGTSVFIYTNFSVLFATIPGMWACPLDFLGKHREKAPKPYIGGKSALLLKNH